ncbi:MAG: histidine phosphatase family protein [Bacteroidetes bacterium]|nr:histidine phosphatase family protein [Bacteroidota bacterium]
MKRILLIRHAQAADPLASQKDFDRPLTTQGVLDAKQQASEIQLNGYHRLYHSAAQRTAETAQPFAAASPGLQLHARKDLYNADLNQLLEILEELWDEDQVILVAHNPGITHLYFHLTEEWEAFEPGTCAELVFPNSTDIQNLKASAKTAFLAHPHY